MADRRFFLGVALATLVSLGLAGDGRAQGTITWNAGYPAGGVNKVTVYGSYTVQVANGWQVTGANFTYTPAGGGTLTGPILDFTAPLANGNVGQRDVNNNVVEYIHQPPNVGVPPGQYQGWLTVSYRDNMGIKKLIISTVVQFTVT